MPLTETQLTETLDRRGLLDDARQPGVYLVELATPSRDADAVTRRWLAHYATMPPNLAGRLAACDALYYAGSHRANVYTRLCEHCTGTRQPSIMAAWPPERVVDVRPCESPRAREWAYALEHADEDTKVWTDGELL